MTRNKKILISLAISFILGIILLAGIHSVSAETEIYSINQNVELKFTCTLNNAIPSAGTNFNITISYPNGTTYINNKQATALGNGAFSYLTNFSILGIYPVQTFCWDGTYSYSSTGTYEITNTGYKLDTSKSIVIFIGLGIMLLIGILLFIFGIYSQGIIKLFSISLSILLIAFSFGYTINILDAGIGEFSGLIGSFNGLWFLFTVLLSVGGIGLVIFLIYVTFKSFSKTRGFED
jgi:sensor histidine kinase YesM